MSIFGSATLEGTIRYRERFKDRAAENHFREQQHLWLSSIGTGTYLGNPDDETDARYTTAISRALELGANVIDTAANYRFQRSERAIGEALGQLTEGQLKFYGVATWNGFRVPAGSSGYHSLDRMAEIAHEVGGESHGFRFIQLPFNLAMPEALTLSNQTLGNHQVCTLEAAAGLGVTVMSSASIFQGRVAQGLPEDLRETLGSLSSDAQTAIQFVRSAPGITTALVGMSSLEHVEDNLQLASVEPLHLERFMQLFSAT